MPARLVALRPPDRYLALFTSILMVLAALGLAQPAQATDTPGQGDSAFNSHFAKPPTYNGEVKAVAVTPDGRFLVGGAFSDKLIMFNSDGTTTGAAATFNSNASGALSGVGDYGINAIAITSTGQVVVGGSFTGRLKMFNPDGTTTGVAATFNANVLALDGDVEGLLRLADDSLLVGGFFTHKVMKLNADGSSTGTALTFNTNVGGALSGGLYVRPMVVTAGGSIIVGGNFTNSLKMLNADGSSSSGTALTFNTNVGSTLTSAVRTMSLDESHGALTIGGDFTGKVKRLNLDGTTTGTAETFNTAVSGLFTGVQTPFSMVANGDGAIVVAGDNFTVRMLNLDGSQTGAAATFDANSPDTTRVYNMASMAGGFILGGGILAGVGRLAADGSSTTGASGTFNLNVDRLVNSAVYSSATFRGGVLVGGSLTGALRMINEDGSATGTAATFNANVGDALNDDVKAIEVLASGKVVVGGAFTGKVKMFNADGTTSGVAAAFNANVAAALDGSVFAIEEMSDGSVVVGGEFTGKLKMFNADGTTTGVAAAFNTNAGSLFAYAVHAVALTSDGSIIVGGDFSDFVKRINSNGTVTGDSAIFNVNVGVGPLLNGGVISIAIARDGSIVLGGDFSDYVKRMNSNGTVTGDSGTFNTNVAGVLDYDAYAVTLTSDGAVVVGGEFLTATTRFIYKFDGAGFPADGGGGGGGGGGGSGSGGSGGSGGSPSEAASPSPSSSPTVNRAPAVLGPVLLGSASTLPPTGLRPGGSALLVDGMAQPVTVVPNSRVRPTALLASGAGLTTQLAGLDPMGRALELTGRGALVLRPDGSISVEGSGVAPNSDVPLYLFSEPRLLGTMKADASGRFKGMLPMPENLILGAHTLQVNAMGADGAVRSLSLGVVLPESKPVAQKVARATVTFASGSAQLSLKARTTLAALAQKVAGRPSSGRVIGCVKRSMTNDTSSALALKRAKAIARYLSARGVSVRTTARGGGWLPPRKACVAAVIVRYTP